MVRIARILCPVDFSESSRRALERAAVLAGWYEAELVALHVAPLPPALLSLAPGVSHATLEPFDVEAMAGELQSFTAQVAARRPGLQLIVRSGTAAPVILDLAREIGPTCWSSGLTAARESGSSCSAPSPRGSWTKRRVRC